MVEIKTIHMTWVFCRCLLRTSTWVLPDRWPHPRRADPFAGVPSIPNDPNDEPADRREDTNRLPSVGDTVWRRRRGWFFVFGTSVLRSSVTQKKNKTLFFFESV